MRCLITLETRPCEEPINFKVLLLPIQLSIIQSIRLLALPSNKGPRVGTAEQGNDSDTHSWEYYTNLCCKSSVQTLRRDKKNLVNCRISEILPKCLIMWQNTEQKMLHMDPKILKCSTAGDATRPTNLQSQNSSSQHKALVPTDSGEENNLHLKHPLGCRVLSSMKTKVSAISAECLNSGTKSTKRFYEFHAHLEKKMIQGGPGVQIVLKK